MQISSFLWTLTFYDFFIILPETEKIHVKEDILQIYSSFWYWEYKLVRSVFLCIYFKTKWMNRSIKKVHRCLLLFPISQAIFEFHLEKMTRLWRRSNFRANFRFLRKKWTGDLLHPSEQPVIRRSNVRRIRRMR